MCRKSLRPNQEKFLSLTMMANQVESLGLRKNAMIYLLKRKHKVYLRSNLRTNYGMPWIEKILKNYIVSKISVIM